ncbi:hypothetical protein ACFQ6U_29635 [Streptomyces sp. NPDC056465]|uniref:hypothetical protein n=1 Tax=unclassified Streptomyces TaxID=2593676 RepID=UPI0036D0BF80
MSIRRTTKARRGASAVALAAVLALAVAGCGGEGEGGEQTDGNTSTAPKASGSDDKQQDTATGEERDPNARLAVLKSADSLEYTVTSAVRDSGGFVTITGDMKNNGDEAFYGVSGWRGNEKEIIAGSGKSASGGTLVDSQGKKRYYVLRDTDGRCLCTSGLTKVEAGKSIPIFMQFPAPPAGTTEVDFTIPTFDTVKIKISE